MSHTLTRRHIAISLGLHVFIALALCLIMHYDDVNNKNFIIFGAHSRHTTQALYKGDSIIPFSGSAGKKSGKASKKSKSKHSGKTQKKSVSTKKQLSHSKKLPVLQKPATLAEAVGPTSMVSDLPRKGTKKRLQKKLKKQAPITPMPIPEEAQSQEIPPEEIPKQQTQAAELEVAPTQEEAPATVNEEESNNTSIDDDDETIAVGIVDSTNPIMRAHQRVISQEFNRVWQPPIGVRKGTECTVRISINNEGHISEIVFIKRSNIPIYDLSIVRLKLAQLDLPPSLHGKKILTVFYQ